MGENSLPLRLCESCHCHGLTCLGSRHRQEFEKSVHVLEATEFLILHAIHKLVDCLFHGLRIWPGFKISSSSWQGASLSPLFSLPRSAVGRCSTSGMFASRRAPRNPVKQGSVGMYLCRTGYIPVHTGTYRYIPVQTSTYQYILLQTGCGHDWKPWTSVPGTY
jgi:hypothetical protein